MPKLVLGFVGLPCAGKGTAIEYLVQKHGFFYSSTSDEIRLEIKARGEEITRDSLQATGGELRQKYGPNVLASRTWAKVCNPKHNMAVIDSIRAIEEVSFLKQKPGFFLIAVDSNPKIRFKRMLVRKRSGDPITWEEFLKAEERDKNREGRDIEACCQAADFHLENNASKKKLAIQLEKILIKICGMELGGRVFGEKLV